MELAASGLFRARWTARIHDEWMRNLLANRNDLTVEQLHRTRDLMNASVLDCLVERYETIEGTLQLTDEDDRHVLAAAIVSGADAIVTFNLKDFPTAVLEPFDIEAQHPDEFLQHQFGLNAASMVVAAQACRRRLKRPPLTVEQYLGTLERQSLPQTVAGLLPFAAVI